jgi:hypothetical protein
MATLPKAAGAVKPAPKPSPRTARVLHFKGPRFFRALPFLTDAENMYLTKINQGTLTKGRLAGFCISRETVTSNKRRPGIKANGEAHSLARELGWSVRKLYYVRARLRAREASGETPRLVEQRCYGRGGRRCTRSHRAKGHASRCRGHLLRLTDAAFGVVAKSANQRTTEQSSTANVADIALAKTARTGRLCPQPSINPNRDETTNLAVTASSELPAGTEQPAAKTLGEPGGTPRFSNRPTETRADEEGPRLDEAEWVVQRLQEYLRKAYRKHPERFAMKPEESPALWAQRVGAMRKRLEEGTWTLGELVDELDYDYGDPIMGVAYYKRPSVRRLRRLA